MNLSKFKSWVDTDPILRTLMAIIGLALISASYALMGTNNLILLVAALTYFVWRAPAIRQKMTILPRGQIIAGLIIFTVALGFLAFAAPTNIFGLYLNPGLFSLVAGVQSIAKPNPQMVKAEAEWAKAKKAKKPTTPKVPKAKTNVQRRLEARLARGKKK